MAITKGAKKAIRTSQKKHVFNVRRKSEMHGVLKSVRKQVMLGNLKEAEALVPQAYKAIDKAAKRGIIKQNTASRKKSNLVASIRRKEKKEGK